MKKIIFIAPVLLFVLCSVVSLSAQSNKSDFEIWKEQQQKEFQNYSDKQKKEFQDYRDKVNAEYAEYMRKTWEEFSAYKGVPAPKSPDPITQPVADPHQEPTADPLPFSKVTPLPKPEPQPQPIRPIVLPAPQPEKPPTPAFSFLFYNTGCKVTWNEAMRFSLTDVSEKGVTDAWNILSNSKYNVLINDCLALRTTLNLGDWSYLQLLKVMSETFFGKVSNEAVLLQMFILTQSGYKVRIARSGNQLALLVPFREIVYVYSYLKINEVKYYIMNKDLQGQKFYILNHEYPKEQYFSWQSNQPQLTLKLNSLKSFTSKNYPEINLSVQTNQNLIDYYNDYPLSSEWNMYVLTDLSEVAKQKLYPALQSAIADKSKLQAAEMLLNFMQTAFDYQTDDVQFGYERPFFADENFYYPFNDCEDRSILYALLVRDLLNLEVVLLHYPGHLSTAVHFPENVNGDYFNIEGKKFVVCDPTYIGARIGMTMPQYKNTNAEIVKI